uniref:Mitochondrial ribosomal protein L44 n=1 Tax=Panagrolaimus davidi TaxID=227884 RepID=A0A914QQR4_9BILA
MFAQRFFVQQPFAATSKLLHNFVRFSSNSSEASTKDYPVPPRLKYIDGYIRDSRNDRKLRDTFIFGTKNGETKELRIEIADEKDIPVVVQSCIDLFVTDVNLYKSHFL